MTFTPINRTDDFATISYHDLWERCGGDSGLIHAELASGDLTALVQVEGESENRFYKVPKNHWHLGPGNFLEGEPGERLFCWGNSTVPQKFDNRPILFFTDDVEAWEARRAPPRENVPEVQSGPESLAADYATFEDCLARAETPSEGYWSPFATLAWVVSRDDRYVAATQLYEVQAYADRAAHCAFAWQSLGNLAGERYGKTYSDAEKELRGQLEAGKLDGGIATKKCGDVEELRRYQWTKWRRSFEIVGLVLVPGYSDFKWPADAVRSAFPALVNLAPAASPRTRFATQAEVEAWYNSRVANWTEVTPPSRNDDIAAGRLVGLSPDRIRRLRAKFAPQSWKAGGRRPGT